MNERFAQHVTSSAFNLTLGKTLITCEGCFARWVVEEVQVPEQGVMLRWRQL